MAGPWPLRFLLHSYSVQPESTDSAVSVSPPREMVDLTVIYCKQKFDISLALDDPVDRLKEEIEKLTSLYEHIISASFNGTLH